MSGPARVIAILGAALLAAPWAIAAEAPALPQFADETATAGLDGTYAGGWQYMVGGGAAVFDCSGDGFPDLVLAGGEGEARLFVNRSTRGGPLRFEKKESGLEIDAVTGAYPLDIDSDGIMDVVLLRVGENLAMRGLGQCRFEKANAAWNFDGGDGWSTSFAATWEKGAAWPTIAIGNYIDRKEEFSPWGSCTDNWLHRPAATEDGFAPPLALKPSYCPLSMMFTDWNRSGTPSLRVSNDREYYEGGQEQLWRVERGLPPRLYTEAEGWRYVRIWGMGIASTDLGGEGYPDYFLTSMADNRLQVLANIPAEGKPKPDYAEVAYGRGVTAHRPYMGDDLRPSTAWHAQFEDVNNDGLADLFVVKGNVEKMPDFAAADPNNLLLQGEGGKFVEAGGLAGVGSTKVGRGGAAADFNLDGLVDLLVVNRWQPAEIWRNVSALPNRWLELRLAQKGANRDAIGSWIEVRTKTGIQRREIFSGAGHAGGQNGWWHFGMGPADSAEVRVLWPDGEASPWQDVAADRHYVLERGKAPSPWRPAP
jgi:hypothetical protein